VCANRKVVEGKKIGTSFDLALKQNIPHIIIPNEQNTSWGENKTKRGRKIKKNRTMSHAVLILIPSMLPSLTAIVSNLKHLQ